MKLHLVVILSIASCAVAAELDVIYEWKYIDYLWDSEEQKNNAVAENRYNYTQILTIDVQKVQDGRVFVTTPAFNPTGVSATLSTVSGQEGPGGPLLRPYPDWSWHNPDTITDCNRIISVWRVAVDDCNRLWVLDSGKAGSTQTCEPKILVFDLRTDTLQKTINIPTELLNDSTNQTIGLLVNIVVESDGFNCEQSRAYVADPQVGSLIIADGSNVWRLDNEIFERDTSATGFTIAGQDFTVTDQLLGLALTPGRSSYDRRLFFRPLASYNQHSAYVNDLRKSLIAPDAVNYTTYDYQLPSQAAAQAFSQDSTLFFGLPTETAIACWNVNKPLNSENLVIVAQNNETLQFSSGVKITKYYGRTAREELWATSNRLQKIYTGTQNFSEINYRVLSGLVSDLTEGTNCKLPYKRRY